MAKTDQYYHISPRPPQRLERERRLERRIMGETAERRNLLARHSSPQDRLYREKILAHNLIFIHILVRNHEMEDGVYPVSLNSATIDVYCQMKSISGCSNNGGWTFVMKADPNSVRHCFSHQHQLFTVEQVILK
jgi:hypothetical protein